VADRDEDSHGQRRPNDAEGAPALHQAAIVGEGRDPDQRGDDSVVAPAELGQQADQGRGGDLANPARSRRAPRG
jgi:hypothetical protein